MVFLDSDLYPPVERTESQEVEVCPVRSFYPVYGILGDPEEVKVSGSCPLTGSRGKWNVDSYLDVEDPTVIRPFPVLTLWVRAPGTRVRSTTNDISLKRWWIGVVRSPDPVFRTVFLRLRDPRLRGTLGSVGKTGQIWSWKGDIYLLERFSPGSLEKGSTVDRTTRPAPAHHSSRTEGPSLLIPGTIYLTVSLPRPGHERSFVS